MQFKRAEKADPTARVGVPAAADPEWTQLYPVLVEWMTATKWDDGSKRQPGSLLVIAEDGVWKAWVNDRDAGRSAWVSGGTIYDLLTSIDLGLRNDTLSWRMQTGKRK